MRTGHIRKFLANDSGQDLMEYAVLAGLVALLSVGAMVNVGTGVDDVFVGVEGSMSDVPTPGGVALLTTSGGGGTSQAPSRTQGAD